MTTTDLEERLLRAVHDTDSDVELLAHEIATSDDAQAYLVELVATLSSISPTSKAADRAAALLEHGLTIAAEHHIATAEAETSAAATTTARDPGDGRRR